MFSFCADTSRHNHEQFIGTASPFRFCLLIEYDGLWGDKALLESSIPEMVKKHVLQLYDLDLDVRIQLIKKQTHTGPKQLFWSDGNPENPQLFGNTCTNYEELLNYNFVEFIKNSPSLPWQLIAEPQFFICTNGKHDACCAKYGAALFNQAQIKYSQVWQTNHLGGDRFAATVLALPQSIYYRRVDENALAEIIHKTQKNEIYLANFAGKTTSSREAQIAEYFIRVQTNNCDMQGLQLEMMSEENNTYTAYFKDKDHHNHYVTIKRANTNINAKLSCNAEKADLLYQYQLLKYWQ